MNIQIILVSLVISCNLGYSKVDTNMATFKDYAITNDQDPYNESQLIGKWYFLSKDNDNKTKSENLIEGKSITIKDDYQFESDVFENFKTGNWNFDKNNHILTFKNENNTLAWKLQKINDFGMVLINIETNEKWMFAIE